jgi:hypothetical protein
MMLPLHSMQSNVTDGCFIYSSKLCMPVHHRGAVSRIISVISRYIHTSSNYMQSIQETVHFCNPLQDFGTGTLTRGNTYNFFFAYTRLSLSLSLSPPLEERAKEGEVGGSWTLVGSNHPRATIPGSRVPYHLGLPYQSDVCLMPVAIRHTSDWYGAMPPFVVCAATRPVSIRYVSNQYGAMLPFIAHAVSNHLDRHFQSPLSGTAC